MIIYRPFTLCVPQFVGGPLGSWGPWLKPIKPAGKSGTACHPSTETVPCHLSAETAAKIASSMCIIYSI